MKSHKITSTLSDQFKSLGIKVGAKELPLPSQSLRPSMEQAFQGEFRDSPFGRVYSIETLYSPNHFQGLVHLSPPTNLNILACYTDDPRWKDIHPSRILFIDTETTGLALSMGTLVFLIGLGHFEGDGFHLTQIIMEEPGQERALLSILTTLLDENTALVSFNGKSFDIPILCSRYALAGEITLLNQIPHFDLLPLVRKLWRGCLPNKSLRSLEMDVLSFIRSGKDVPGWYIPELYKEYLIKKDARLLEGIFYHNAMDILSIAALFCLIYDILSDPLHHLHRTTLNIRALADILGRVSDYETVTRLFSNSLMSDTFQEKRCEIIRQWSYLEKRRRNFPKAVELWKQAAQYKDISALIELAKYYEHQEKNYSEAIYWVENAVELISEQGEAIINQTQLHCDLITRYARLTSKASKKATSQHSCVRPFTESPQESCNESNKT